MLVGVKRRCERENANKARGTVNREPECAGEGELAAGERVKNATTCMDVQTRVDRGGSPNELRAINC